MNEQTHQSDLLAILNQADQWLRRLIRQASLDALWIGVGVFLASILAQLTMWTPSRILGGLEAYDKLVGCIKQTMGSLEL